MGIEPPTSKESSLTQSLSFSQSQKSEFWVCRRERERERLDLSLNPKLSKYSLSSSTQYPKTSSKTDSKNQQKKKSYERETDSKKSQTWFFCITRSISFKRHNNVCIPWGLSQNQKQNQNRRQRPFFGLVFEKG